MYLKLLKIADIFPRNYFLQVSEFDIMIEHLVIDSGGFIKNAPIREICNNAYTIPEVVAEIKDKETRKRLKMLPYELHFKDPNVQAIQKVSQGMFIDFFYDVKI